MVHSRINNDLDLGLSEKTDEEIRYAKDDVRKLKAIADYQFGWGCGEALFKGNINVEKSKKTGKIRHIYDGKTLIVNMRASDSYLILSKEGARRLHASTAYPKNRVVVNKDSEPFALDKNVLPVVTDDYGTARVIKARWHYLDHLSNTTWLWID